MFSYLREEKKLWRKGYRRVACLDEAGRGPLAGPVVAVAVCVKPGLAKLGLAIKDSKKLSAKKREELYHILTNHPDIKWGIGRVSEKVIDRINILEATKLAMERATKNLAKKYQRRYQKKNSAFGCGRPKRLNKEGQIINFLIIDGNFKINSKIPQKSIIKADEKVFSCIAASIIAKVTRDRIMERYHKKYPSYGFDQHKGYPTKQHIEALRKYGCCGIHRRSFRPVKAVNF